MMMVGEASRLGIALPRKAHQAISTEATWAINKGWIVWAGAPEMQFDPASAFTSAQLANWLALIGTKLVQISTEARWCDGMVEKRLDMWKMRLVRLAHRAQLTGEADPFLWAARVSFVLNSRVG